MWRSWARLRYKWQPPHVRDDLDRLAFDPHSYAIDPSFMWGLPVSFLNVFLGDMESMWIGHWMKGVTRLSEAHEISFLRLYEQLNLSSDLRVLDINGGLGRYRERLIPDVSDYVVSSPFLDWTSAWRVQNRTLDPPCQILDWDDVWASGPYDIVFCFGGVWGYAMSVFWKAIRMKLLKDTGVLWVDSWETEGAISDQSLSSMGSLLTTPTSVCDQEQASIKSSFDVGTHHDIRQLLRYWLLQFDDQKQSLKDHLAFRFDKKRSQTLMHDWEKLLVQSEWGLGQFEQSSVLKWYQLTL